ncbi:unnamed protein product, partial [Linum tenue]
SNHNIDREHQVSDRGLSTPVPCICFCDYIHLPLRESVRGRRNNGIDR